MTSPVQHACWITRGWARYSVGNRCRVRAAGRRGLRAGGLAARGGRPRAWRHEAGTLGAAVLPRRRGDPSSGGPPCPACDSRGRWPPRRRRRAVLHRRSRDASRVRRPDAPGAATSASRPTSWPRSTCRHWCWTARQRRGCAAPLTRSQASSPAPSAAPWRANPTTSTPPPSRQHSSWLRPMRGLKQDGNARVVMAGHVFVQNLRRGHYELGIEEPVNRRVAIAFDALAVAICF